MKGHPGRGAPSLSGYPHAASAGPVRELHEPLLRSMFHAAGQPARTQLGGPSRCPRMTAVTAVSRLFWHERGTPPICKLPVRTTVGGPSAAGRR